MAHIVLKLALVENKIGAGFVDGVVGEMHLHIFLVIAVGFLILAGGKSAESLLIHIYFKRGHRSQKHVHPQIEFIVVDQQRVLYVLLHHHLLSA